MLIGGADSSQSNSASGWVADTTTETFVQDVIDASRDHPVLVDFWAPWCGPCRQLTPLLEKIVNEAKGAMRLVKMNIDEHPAVAQQLRIQSIPAVYAFSGGRPVDGFMGALPESEVRAFIARLLGEEDLAGDVGALLDAADAALSAGDVNAAAQAFAEVLNAEPENARAVAGMARCHAAVGDVDRARALLDQAPPSVADDPAITAVRAAIELAGDAAELPAPSKLESKVSKTPDDHALRFDFARSLLAHGDMARGMDELLTIVRKDRTWNDDAARKHLLKVFDALGAAHPEVVAGRRKLSSVLFS